MKFHSYPTLAGLGIAAALLASSRPQAQEFFGRWEDEGLDNSIELFVAPGGGGGGTADNPFPSITQALALVSLILNDPAVTPPAPTVPVRITINVAPATYDQAGTGEIFPLRIPARGVALETWPNGSLPPNDRPLISGVGFLPVIQVDWMGDLTVPSSVIHGLELQNGNPGIEIDPSLLSAPTMEPVGIEIRQCFVHDCAPGIRITTAANFVTHHVVEDNDIGDLTPILHFAVREQNFGSASTLYRSNRIQLYEEGFNVTNGAEVAACAPRLFSNTVQRCERTVNLTNCDSHLINNTIAFAVDFTAVPAVTGVTITGGTFELDNNLIWCPDTPTLVPAIDLTINGAIGTQVANVIEDATPALFPLLVGGDVHLGMFPSDLHLSPGSPLIGAGSVVEAGLGVRSVPVAGGPLARTDVSMDVDTDGRLFASAGEAIPTVDIGADEFHDTLPSGAFDARIEFPTTPTQDRFGNINAQPLGVALPPGISRRWNADLAFSGPPNGFFGLFLGHGYFDEVLDPVFGVSTENGPIYQNLALLPLGIGNLMLDIKPGAGTYISAGGGFFDATGAAAMTGVTVAQFADASVQEVEWYFQVVTLDFATGRLALSNRARMELSERP
jgi:hypothetical protein